VIVRNRIRPATRAIAYDFAAPFSLAAALDVWEGLDELDQEEWNDLAEVTFGWPIEGSPRYLTGAEFFANYLTVLRALDPVAPVPSAPGSGPTWQDRPKFFEFAEWESAEYTLKAETSFDAGTVLLFSGLPPTRANFDPQFAQEVLIGNHEFVGGLAPDDTTNVVHAMMETAFGTITESQKIWGRVWECQDGFIRTLKDPCTNNPTSTPPVTGFEICVFNDWDSPTMECDFYAEDGDFNSIGSLLFGEVSAYATTCADMEFDPGSSLEDMAYLSVQVEWEDGEFLFEEDIWDDSNPFEYTITPF